MKTSRKILLSVGAIGAAAGIAGLGTFATFTDTAAESPTIATGTVDINFGNSGTADNRLNIGATGMVPGDSLQRRVKLTNAGSESLASIALTTTASPSTLLDTDATNGLQMKIQRCSVAWVESTAAPYTYVCAGTTSDVLAERAIIGPNLALTSMAALTPGATDDMVVTVRLPSTAGNTFQNLSSTITYTFTATQRAGGAK